MESFVDITYRGLEVGRRVKLTEVSAEVGYVEVAIPMPVGTKLDVTIGDGLSFGATVRGVHEQVSGSPRPPGMVIAPELAAEPAQRWWAERVTVKEAPRAPRTAPIAAVDAEAARVAAERDRKASGAPPIGARTTRPMPSPEVQDVAMVGEAAGVYEDLARRRDDDGIVDDGKKTEVMEAVDPEMLAKLMSGSSESLPIVDDGKKTVVMETPVVVAVDEASDDSGGNGSGNGGGGSDDPGASGPIPAQGKRRKKRRR